MDETTHANVDGLENDERPAVEQVVLESLALSEEAEAPRRILVAPWGEVVSAMGSFVVDAESIRETIAAFERHGTDLPIDYEHQTLGGRYSSPNGQAPAAGWIKSFSALTPAEAATEGCGRLPGLWAEVAWTAEAAVQLRERKYRYLSPVALVRRADRRLVGLHSAALTNKPGIVGMRPLVASDGGAGPDDTVEPLALSQLRRALEMDESATEDIVLVTAAERLATLAEAERERDADARVRRALSAGKLTAAQRAWAASLARRDPAEFDAWEQAAPIVVPLGRTPAPVATNVAHGRADVETAARAEWRAHRALLEGLCSEDTYAADALRQAALEA
ncbi:MAG: phage protease [Phycisphaerae bacterium]